ncbi:MAG: hypothetical protein KDD10_07970 [Phaeodactylibacter sp.]|nr:hypothetical protein [Phaeodactylibacter sp.]MCB9295818.1 hypothetical protein [Lewinellaceae bacterium]
MKQSVFKLFKINLIVITALAFSVFSCQKEEQVRPAVQQQTPVNLVFKPTISSPAAEITLNFHIDTLFESIDFNELTRLSTQVRIAENLPASLELE